MARQKDTRNYNRPRREEAAVRNTAELVSERLSGSHRVEAERVNPITGSPAVLNMVDAPPGEGSLIQQALDFVQGGTREAMGFGPKDKTDFVPDPYVQRTQGRHRYCPFASAVQRYSDFPNDPQRPVFSRSDN
jgi:hypothetical protein